MDREIIDQAIIEKYIQPTRRPPRDYIGVEFELPIVNVKKEPVDFSVVHRLTDAFMETFAFRPQVWDDESNVVSAQHDANADDLSFDCSYNTLEFSFGKERDLNRLSERFMMYYRFAQDYLSRHHHALTGMGINPCYLCNHNIPIPNGRYRMLLHHLRSYTRYTGQMLFHNIPHFGLIICASQTHIDVSEDEIIRTINLFHRIEPLKALLFANSPLRGDLLCARDYLWKQSLHGLNPHNVDGYAKDLSSIGELVSYIRSMSLYCLDRGGKYINFSPTPLDSYFSGEYIKGEYFNGTDYEPIRFVPRIEDLDYLRSFKFVDLTYRGTIELRSVCQQPVCEIFSAPAFHIGLKQNLDALEEYLHHLPEIYEQGYSVDELRQMFVRTDLPAFLKEATAVRALTGLLDIARDGLQRRGYGEAHFLDPLYVRAKKLQSPAREMTDGIRKGASKEYYIQKFGTL